MTLLAGVVAGGVLLLNSGGGSNRSSSAVSLAAYTTGSQAGYRFNIVISASASGFDLKVNGSGALNLRPSPSGTMNVNVLGRAYNEVVSDGYIYVQSSPSTWYRVAIPAYADNGGVAQNPTAALSYLRAAGTVDDLGTESVEGAATTHYHAVVDLSRYAQLEGGSSAAAAVAAEEQATGVTTLPLDVWIDSSHLVRELSLAIPINHDGVTISESMTMTFSDYGAQPAPTPPPASEVTNTPPSSGL